ncbi:4Fe-4S dicluster domain-containing protein [Thermococcus sp. 5-4]|uniref:4Fe-4S dicluster domain-containing protein n=1 Tax=Thermococcus sp. 5-4 TaxID=2008440 RepID=UPI000B49FC29|nr:4Fe-4S dicluster domain-containing protein [Thermococcus sp. 5-4]ASA78125.1 ferredoxin [Thermococcus sp. 5-4]
MERKYLYLDYLTCIGCETCETVCDFIHDGSPHIRIYVTENKQYLPINCKHCDDAPCVRVCPTNAIYRDEDGAVRIAENRCIGCLACLQVCPYGVPFYSLKVRAITKCDMCADRREEGLEPACALMCPAEAIQYGPLEMVLELVNERRAKNIPEHQRELSEEELRESVSSGYVLL